MGLFLVSFLFGVSTSSLANESSASRLVYRIQIRGSINPATEDYLRSSVLKAEKDHTEMLVVELDTPGGLLSSVHKMAGFISESTVPVVVFVTPSGATATSAGALLLLSSHYSAMTLGTNIGAAHPVDASGKGIEGPMGEKVLNDTIKFSESQAELRGRNKTAAAEIVSKSKSFTATESVNEKVSELIARDVSELLEKMDGKTIQLSKSEKKLQLKNSVVKEIEMSLGQKLLHLVSNPNLAALLSTLAMLLIFMELKTPGGGIAGVLGVICLILSFMAFQTLPIRTGGLALIGLGMISIIAEIFATSHGLLALGGVVSFILGLVWIIDPAQTALQVSPSVWIPAGLFLGGGFIFIGYFARKVVRDSEEALRKMGGHGNLGLTGYTGVIETVEGNEDSKSFSGKILIRGETWTFKSSEAFQIGDEAVVNEVNGFTVLISRKKG